MTIPESIANAINQFSANQTALMTQISQITAMSLAKRSQAPPFPNNTRASYPTGCNSGHPTLGWRGDRFPNWNISRRGTQREEQVRRTWRTRRRVQRQTK